MHFAVAKSVLYSVDLDVEQYPISRDQLHHTQRVVEAVSSTPNSKCLPDAHRYEVTENRKRCRIDRIDDRRDASPHLGATVVCNTVELIESATFGESLFEIVMERPIQHVHVLTLRQ